MGWFSRLGYHLQLLYLLQQRTGNWAFGFWLFSTHWSTLSERVILKYNRAILLVMMDTTNIEDNNMASDASHVKFHLASAAFQENRFLALNMRISSSRFRA